MFTVSFSSSWQRTTSGWLPPTGPGLAAFRRHRTQITVPRYAFSFEEYGWGLENYGVDPGIEVLNTPDLWPAGRDRQLETAVRLALEALGKQPPPVPPDPSTGPVNARSPLPPRPR